MTLCRTRTAGLLAAGVYELTLPNGITVGAVATVDVMHAPTSTARTATVDVAELSLLAFES